MLVVISLNRLDMFVCVCVRIPTKLRSCVRVRANTIQPNDEGVTTWLLVVYWFPSTFNVDKYLGAMKGIKQNKTRPSCHTDCSVVVRLSLCIVALALVTHIHIVVCAL